MEDPVVLDEVLDKFSIFGRYHLQLMFFFIYAYATSAMTITTYIFAVENTEYSCVDEGYHNNTCGSINGVRCPEWTYENPNSFVAEFQIVCEDWKRTLVGTSHIFGYMVGLLFIGPLSDKIGRKKTIILTGVAGAVIGYLKSFSNSYWLYVVLEFLVSVIGDWYSPLFVLNLEIVSAKKRVFQIVCEDWKRTLVGTSHIFGYMVGLLFIGPLSDKIGRKKTIILTGVAGAVIGYLKSFSNSYWLYVVLEFLVSVIGDWYSPLFVLNLEIVSAKKRVVYHYLCCIGGIIGAVLAPTAAWAMPYWRNYLRVVYTPCFLFISFCFIDESPRWLLLKGRKDEAVANLLKIARLNNVNLNRDALTNIVVEQEVNNISYSDLLKTTLRSRALLKRCLICIVWWTTSIFVYYGSLIQSVFLEGNKYINYALLHIIDLPGIFILMYILNKFKRKKPLMYSFFAAAVFYIIHIFLPRDHAWLSILTYMVGKLMNYIYFHTTYIYTSELFPTYTRNSMHALCSSIGRIGGIVATQTPLLLVYWSGLPTLLFASASLVAGLVTFLVPDTADVSLPDTVAQAELIGIQKKHKRNIAGIDNLAMKEATEKIDSIL